jgi:sugar diacid utilization regulator
MRMYNSPLLVMFICVFSSSLSLNSSEQTAEDLNIHNSLALMFPLEKIKELSTIEMRSLCIHHL